MGSLTPVSGRIVFLLTILLSAPAFSSKLKLGNCISQDEYGECELVELLPVDGHIVNRCTEFGGSFGDFGACTIAAGLAKNALEKANRENEVHVLPPAPTNNLLPLVQKCEAAAQSTTSTCARSAAHLSRAQNEIDSLNDLLSGPAGVSPAYACTKMRDSVSSARSMLSLWQSTCGGAMTTCQSTCDGVQAAVAAHPSLALRVAKANQACRGHSSQREEVQRSITIASSAVAGSSLCRQQLGANDDKRKQQDEASKANLSPTASQFPTTQLPSILSAPNFSNSHSSLPPQHQEPQAPMNQRPVGLPEDLERDTQGSVAGPGRIRADNTFVDSDSSARKPTQASTPPSAGAPVRFDVGNKISPPAARPAVANGSAPSRETPKMGFYPAVGQAAIPTAKLATQPDRLNVRGAAAAPGARKNFRAAVARTALKQSLVRSQLRWPSHVAPQLFRSSRSAEIADRNTSLFGNIRRPFARLAENL